MAASVASDASSDFVSVLEAGGIRWSGDPIGGESGSAPTVGGDGQSRSRRFGTPRRGVSPAGRPAGGVRPRPLASGGRTEMPTAPGRVRRSAGGARIEAPGRQLRLTRRGRLVALLVFAAVGLAVFGLGRATAGADSAPRHPAEVVVQQGDSLWSIAVRAYPGEDPRDVVGRLERLNHLTGGAVQAGEKLRLP